MNAMELLLPLVDECRRDFGNSSLVLNIRLIQLDQTTTSEDCQIKTDCKFGEKLVPISRTLNGHNVKAFSKQILHMISEPCININDLLCSMHPCDMVSAPYLFEHPLSLRIWRDNIKSRTLVEMIPGEEEEIITDKVLMQLIDYALLQQIDRDPLITSVADAFFPAAVSGYLYVLCEYNRHDSTTCDIRVFDKDGWKVAELLSVAVEDDKPSNGNDCGLDGLLPIDNREVKPDVRTKLTPIIYDAKELTHPAVKGEIVMEKESTLCLGYCSKRLASKERYFSTSDTNSSRANGILGIDYSSKKPLSSVSGFRNDLTFIMHTAEGTPDKVENEMEGPENAANERQTKTATCDHNESFFCDVPYEQNESGSEGKRKVPSEDGSSAREISNVHKEKNKIRKRIRRVLNKFIIEKKQNDDKTFIWLGFDSLKLASFESKLEEEFAAEFSVPYGCTFLYNTVLLLTNFLYSLSTVNSSTDVVTSDYDRINRQLRNVITEGRSIPLSATQTRLVFMAKFEPENDSQFVEKIAVKIACIQIRRLSIAINKLIARQTTLRTVYSSVDQQVLSLSESYFAIRIHGGEGRNDDSEYLNIFAAPPLKVVLLKIDLDYCLEIHQHHISTDGYSIGIFMRELKALYNGDRLEKLTFHYSHFVMLELHRLSDTAYVKRREDFWLRQLENFQCERLSTDKQRKPTQTFSGQTIEYKLDKAEANLLSKIARCLDVTEFALLLALYHVLISIRYDRVDFCTGISVAERRNEEHLRSLIGCLVNIVPIRLKIDPSEPVAEFITNTAYIINENVQNQLPFERLLKLLDLERDISSSPLFQVFLVMDVVEVPEEGDQRRQLNDECLEGVLMQRETRYAKYDQVWYFMRNDQNLTIKVEYNIDLFYKNSIKKTINEFVRLIRIVGNCPNSPISTIELERNEEKLHRYEMISKNRQDFPTTRTPVEIITAQASMNVYCNRITYNKTSYSSVFLKNRSNQIARVLAQYFMQHWGEIPRSDTPIVILMRRNPQLILFVLALWKCGFAVVPLSIDWPKQQYYDITRSLPYSTIISSSDFVEKNEFSKNCLYIDVFGTIDDSLLYSMRLAKRSQSLNDLAYITYTSGSTGIPKGVCSELLGVNNLAMNYTKHLAINQWNVVYQLVNHSFDIFFGDIVEALTNGATLMLAKQRIATKEEITSVTHAYIMPAFLSALDQNMTAELRKLEAINFGGDFIDTNFLQKSIDYGLNIYQQYGLTEATIYSTFHRMKSLDKSNCIGFPLSNVHFTVRNANANCMPNGSRGICCLSGIGLSRGYINDEQRLTACKFKLNNYSLKEDTFLRFDNRYFITGDLSELDASNRLRLFGRADNQTKIRGQIVDLLELETIISSMPMVDSCVVITRMHKTSSILTAHVIINDNYKQIEHDQLQGSIVENLMHNLPSFMIPSYFFFLSSFPLNSNGKIDRQQLQKVNLPTQHTNSTPYNRHQEMSELQKTVCHIFSDVLDVPSVSLEDSFFALGGDSLKALLAIQRINAELAIQISLKDIFRYQTFGGILQFCKGNDYWRERSTHKSSAVKLCFAPIEKFWLHKNGIPLSFAQQRLWFIHNYEHSSSSSYILRIILKLRGRVDIDALSWAINVLIREHSILRTVFRMNTGSVTQVVLSLTESYVTLFSQNSNNSEMNRLELLDTPPFQIIMRPQRSEVDLDLYMHHILTDGHSLRIISEHLIQVYGSLAHSQLKSLTRFAKNTMGQSYAKFSYQQRKEFQEINDDIKQWIDQLKNIEALEIPTDFVRPKLFETSGKIISADVNIRHSEIDAFCARHNCTLFTYLLACYALLMRTLSCQRRFLIGTASANRDAQNLETVGFFANSVPLDINTEFSSVSDLVNWLQLMCIRNLEHQNVPFELIVERLNPLRDTSKSPLFQHTIVLHNASPSQMPKLEGLSIEVSEIHSREAKYDETWFFEFFNSTLRLQVEYCCALFHKSTVQKQIQMFIAVAKSLLKAERIDQITFITNEELITERSRNHTTDTPRTSLCCILTAQCLSSPNSEMLRWFKNNANFAITYEEAFDFINHLCKVILQSILCSQGIPATADDCVAIICAENFLSVLSIFAVQLAGCCYCPIDRNSPLKRIDFIRSDTASKLALLCDGTVTSGENFVNVGNEFQRWRLNVGVYSRRCFNRVSNFDLAYIIYTSGSTGKPKGVCVEHQSSVNVIEYTTRQYGIDTSQRFYQFTKLTFDASLAYTFGAALNGATMCLRDEDVDPFEDIRRNLPLDILHMTPAVLGEISSVEVKSLEPQVALWSVGGDKLSEHEMNKLINSGVPLIQVYGPTEVTVFQTTAKMKKQSHTSTTIGATINNVFGYILNEDGQQLPSNVKGELFMVGENVSRGYMNTDKKAGDVFIINRFRTQEDIINSINRHGYKSGDIVKRLPSGEMIFYGRKDMQIKVNGYRIELGEIEATVCRLDGVSSCVAILHNNRIIVFVEGHCELSEQQKIDHLSEMLPHYMLPSKIVCLKKLPLNQNAKIDRRVLESFDENSTSMNAKKQCEVEETLLRIWSETLKREGIGTRDNFFSLGGHSMLATTICYRIREALHCECPVRLIFETQTIEKLAKCLTVDSKEQQLLKKQQRNVIEGSHQVSQNRSKNDSSKGRSEVHANIQFRNATELKQKDRLINICERNRFPLCCCELQKPLLDLYYRNPIDYNLKAYETGFRIQLNVVDLSLLEKCLNRVIVRHEALRTSFFTESSNYFQVIKSASESFIAVRYRQEKSEHELLELAIPFESIPIMSFLEDADGRPNFVLRMSHVLTDGRSMQVIAQELFTSYCERKLLRKNNIRYASFVTKYNHRIEIGREENEEYWRNIVTEIGETLLETDKQRSTNKEGDCRYVIKRLSRLNEIIDRLSGKNGCSNFVVMVAAFGVVLSHRLPQNSKMVIGCPIDMREDPSQSSVGLHISTVPIVLDSLCHFSTVQSLLHHTAERVQNAIQHAAVAANFMNSLYGGDELIRCMIVLENFNDNPLLEGNHFKLLEDNSGYTKYELSMFISQSGTDIIIRFEYMSALFYAETIMDMVIEWAGCIKAFDKGYIATNYELHLPTASDIPSTAFPKLIKTVSVFQPKNKSFFTHQKQYNYSTMLNRLCEISAAIQQLAICTTGEPLRVDTIVPIVSKKSLDTLLICMSIIFSGAAYLPIDQSDPVDRIRCILKESQATYYIAHNDYNIKNVRAIPAEKLFERNHEIETDFKQRALPDDLAYVIYTSGTTGRPKGVAIEQKSLMNLANQSARDFWMSSTDCVYQFTNFTFDNSVLEMVMALSNSCALFVEEHPFSVELFLCEIRESYITHALLFPGLVEMFSDAELIQLSQLRYWIVGAERASERLISSALINGVNVIQNYGPTETTAYALSKRMKLLDHANNLGKPTMNVFCTAQKWNGDKALPLTSAELLIGGMGLMRGYLNRDTTCELNHYCTIRSQQKLYASGDIVKQLRNGDIVFLGRRDEQVKIRGFRVEISEIEMAVCQMPQIRQCKVILKQQPLQILIAYITLIDDHQTFDSDTVRQYCMRRLPYYMIPTYFKRIREFPLTSNNKIDVSRLPMIEEDERKGCRDEPENVLEFQLWLLFKEVLVSAFVTTSDDFFAIGGNSLRAVRLVRRIEEEINVKLDIRFIFQYRTIRRIAQLLKRKLAANVNKSVSQQSNIDQQLPIINYDNIPLSFQQQQILFLCHTKQADYYSLLFVQNFDISIEYNCLRMAFLRLVMRQPTLRTIFFDSDYETKQAILSGTECFFCSEVEENIQSNNTPLFITAPLFLDDGSVCPVYCGVSRSAKAYTVRLLLNHILSDAWSTRLIETELSQLYRAITNGRFDDKRLDYTYAHYSIEQHARKDELQKLASEYARKLYLHIEDCRSIVSIFGRSNQTESGTIHCFQTGIQLDDVTCERFSECCAKLSTTTFALAVAAVAVSVHRLSKYSTLIIGAPAANRSKRATEALVGNFLNNLLIPSVWSKNGKALCDYVHWINQKVDEARLYESVPYCLLKDALGSGREFGGAILCEVYVNCRYNLEDGATNQIPSTGSKISNDSSIEHRSSRIVSLQNPKNQITDVECIPKCAYPIEVDLDLISESLQISVRIRKDIGGQQDAQNLNSLIQKSLEEILRSAERGQDVLDGTTQANTLSQSLSSTAAALTPTDFRTDQSTDPKAPSEDTLLKLQIKHIWKQCLQLKQIDDDADFFLSGGNSLICLKLKRMIAKQLNIIVEIEEIFENKTFTQMLALICTKRRSSVLKRPSTTLIKLHGDTIVIHKLLVLFHPLIGGVTLPYAALIRKLITTQEDITIIGIQHPNTFSFTSNNSKLSHSIESLCSVYVDDAFDVIKSADSCVFVGASMGAILAFECSAQLKQRGISVEHIISIDGVAQPYAMRSITFKEHQTQMNAVMARYIGNDNELSERTRDAMIGNAWHLLQMAERYRPKSCTHLKISLLKVGGCEEDDYGWHKLANTYVKPIPGNHENMLNEDNSFVVANIIAEILHNSTRF